jgi:hypothetical protein
VRQLPANAIIDRLPGSLNPGDAVVAEAIVRSEGVA